MDEEPKTYKAVLIVSSADWEKPRVGSDKQHARIVRVGKRLGFKSMQEVIDTCKKLASKTKAWPDDENVSVHHAILVIDFLRSGLRPGGRMFRNWE